MRYLPFVRGVHRSPVISPHKGQWRGTLMFSLICAWINGWVNNREADDLWPHRPHYDVTSRYRANLTSYAVLEFEKHNRTPLYSISWNGTSNNIFVQNAYVRIFSQSTDDCIDFLDSLHGSLNALIKIIYYMCKTHHYRQTSSISRTKSKNLSVFRFVSQLSLPSMWHDCIKSRMKM